MSTKNIELVPSRIVMEDYLEQALEYYQSTINKISPYFFINNNLVKLIGFQQLIVSKNYQIKRDDARSEKGVDYVRECVAQVKTKNDLIAIMNNMVAFDLCLTAPSFKHPELGAFIRRSYCKVGDRHFDCPNCSKKECRDNYLDDHSSIMIDLDAPGQDLVEVFSKTRDTLKDIGVTSSIKLSSLKGLHLNIGLPSNNNTNSQPRTLLDRSVLHYCVLKELRERGIPVDDNSLDPVPIIRAPYSIHYKRLTPSLPVTDNIIREAIEILQTIEKEPLEKRIPLSLELTKEWTTEWFVSKSTHSSYQPLLEKWGQEALVSVLRERDRTDRKRTIVGDYLIKGSSMTKEDEEKAFSLLLEEGKDPDLARKILADNKNKPPRPKKAPASSKEVLLRRQEDIPKKVLEIPPPVIFLLVDNATVSEMTSLTGAAPLEVEAQCTHTEEAMKLLFQDSKLLQRYARTWNRKSQYVGGLYTASRFCSGADRVISVKMDNVWDRDKKVLEELERILNEDEIGLVAIHLLGLDHCKDKGLATDGAMLIFKRVIRTILGTDSNIVITSDHSGERTIPIFLLLKHVGVEDR